jgi:hypothetical protein
MAASPRRRSASEAGVRILEQGDIYFFYRPKVGREDARGAADVQRLYLILSPRARQVYRLVIVPEKRLPSVTGRGDRSSWGFVERVGRRPEEVEDELDPRTYETRTRGERHRPAARPAGEACTPSCATTTTRTWPTPPGEVQRALNILEEGGYAGSRT